MYCILFAYSDVLAIQSVLTQRPKWKQYFTQERMRVPIEEVEQHFYDQAAGPENDANKGGQAKTNGVEDENIVQTNGQKRVSTKSQVSDNVEKTAQTIETKPSPSNVDRNLPSDSKKASSEEDFQKLGTKRQTSSPFELPGKPKPSQLEAYWRALCVKAGFDRNKLNVKYNEYYFKYKHANEMLLANTSLCHQVAYLPKELHEEYLEEYRQFLMTNYCKLQPTFPEINMRCDYILIEAEV